MCSGQRASSAARVISADGAAEGAEVSTIRPASPPPPHPRAGRGCVLLVAGLMTMSAASIDINLPAVPATAAELGSALPAAQLTVTAFFVGFAAGQAAAGPRAILPGLALFFLAFGLVAANAGALALQPHGSIAGSAAGVVGVLQTVLPGCFAGFVALLADGAPLGLLAGMPLVLVASVVVLARATTRRG